MDIVLDVIREMGLEGNSLSHETQQPFTGWRRYLQGALKPLMGDLDLDQFPQKHTHLFSQVFPSPSCSQPRQSPCLTWDLVTVPGPWQ